MAKVIITISDNADGTAHVDVKWSPPIAKNKKLTSAQIMGGRLLASLTDDDDEEDEDGLPDELDIDEDNLDAEDDEEEKGGEKDEG